MYTLSSWRSHLGNVAVDFLHQKMYTLSYWKSHLGSVGVDFLHQNPARTEGDPFTAYVSEEVTQVSRMTNVQPNFLEKSPR